ncbi:nucleotide sugar dehydrogenase [Confluentibacter sediminis]|uniref:nucleotide sugar dehydrogenase n=1 Tax=Confluentibacter sediminis TaxID=2219045 RepID=UPI000DAE7C53|nr:nucleotide sugar dehydrogenase [Confluentibacter sediminis]
MKNIKIAVIGLGYVGLPLARLFATKYNVVGFDINEKRISQLLKGIDNTQEIEADMLLSVLKKKPNNDIGLLCSFNIKDIKDCNYYIVTVPTPIDKNNRPNLNPLFKSSETVGSVLKKNDIVIYESTVYPGATEEECVPILETLSNLKFNIDFYVGYSPERINPGDKLHTVDKILKVTSGSTPETGKKINELYASVITAGTYLAPSIKVAEAAKVIENSQRDINIAFVNELAKIFNLLGIDTHEVLEAASTKWNFLPFKPGLVGGHCIGVDPYYLAQKSIAVGHHPEIILAGRRVNDGMSLYVVSQVIKLMLQKEIALKDSKILILGFTFKENCPDVRNTKVVDIVTEIKGYGIDVTIFDPWANPEEVELEYGLETTKILPKTIFDAIILTVAHSEFQNLDLKSLLKPIGVLYDVKGVIKQNVSGRL